MNTVSECPTGGVNVKVSVYGLLARTKKLSVDEGVVPTVGGRSVEVNGMLLACVKIAIGKLVIRATG